MNSIISLMCLSVIIGASMVINIQTKSIENKLDALIATQATYIDSNSCVVMKMPESDVDYYKRSGGDR